METPTTGVSATPEELAKAERSFYQDLTKKLIARVKKEGPVTEFDHKQYTFNLYAILEDMGIDPKKAQNDSEEKDLIAKRAIIWRKEKAYYERAIERENNPVPSAKEIKEEARYREEFHRDRAREERWRDDEEANYYTHPID